ncbi:hypothetical protein K402DRAFT_302039, partial [Aulographum hederae CBS 113979]
ASAGGFAAIKNKCDFDVHVWSVSADGASSATTISKNGGSYKESYKKPSVGGMSLKLSPSNPMGAVTQFEYTLADQIFYDISDIDCVQNGNCPFYEYGLYLDSAPGCPNVTCAAGIDKCPEAYNLPDDIRTSACQASADLTLYLC